MCLWLVSSAVHKPLMALSEVDSGLIGVCGMSDCGSWLGQSHHDSCFGGVDALRTNVHSSRQITTFFLSNSMARRESMVQYYLQVKGMHEEKVRGNMDTQIVVHDGADNVRLEVRTDGETVWLPQKQVLVCQG